MSEFEVGDEVGVVALTAPHYNERGMVCNVGGYKEFTVKVKFELPDGDRSLWYRPSELRLQRAVVRPGRTVQVEL